MRASRKELYDRRRDPRAWPALLIGAVAAVLAYAAKLDPRWHDRLDYLRDAVMSGEIWRLITGHLMHLSVEHAALNLSGLALVAWIFSRELDARAQWLVCVAGVACIDATLRMASIDRYVGLSGVLHAWFAAGATRWLLASRDESVRLHGRDLAARKRVWGASLLIGLCVKLALEWRHQAFWLEGLAFPVITVAHRAGAAAGCLCGGYLAWISRRESVAGVEARVSRSR